MLLKFFRKPRRPVLDKTIFSVLWPTLDNYDQFRALCDDELPRTLVGYISVWGPTEDFIDRGGGEFVRIPFDPQLMAAWCRPRHGKIDEVARAAYARYLLDTEIRPRRHSDKAKVNLRDGRIDVGAIVLEPALDEALLLAAIGDAAKPLIHNGAFRSYLLPKAKVHGRHFRPSTYFRSGIITSIHLTYADPDTEGGSAWESHSFERERAIARDDARWLADTLGSNGSSTDAYNFEWGSIWSGLDERSGFSTIVVTYDQAPDQAKFR